MSEQKIRRALDPTPEERAYDEGRAELAALRIQLDEVSVWLCDWDEDTETVGELAKKVCGLLKHRLDDLIEVRQQLDEQGAEKRRLAREIDVALHGEDGAAKQASLCDLVVPALWLRLQLDALQKQLDECRQALASVGTCASSDGGRCSYCSAIVDEVFKPKPDKTE